MEGSIAESSMEVLEEASVEKFLLGQPTHAVFRTTTIFCQWGFMGIPVEASFTFMEITILRSRKPPWNQL